MDWTVLVETSQFGAGARFIAVGGDAVLAEGGDAPFQVGLLDFPDEPPPVKVTRTPLPDGLRGVGVTTYQSTRFDGVYVLACDEEERCRLLRQSISARGGALGEVPGAVVPDGMMVRGLTADRGSDSLCVYGDGMRCFGSSWRVAIASGSEIRKVSVGDTRVLALGVDGRTWLPSAGEEPWREGPDLRAQQPHGIGLGSLHGSSPPVFAYGRGWWSLTDDGRVEHCALERDVLAMFVEVDVGWAELLLADGDRLAYGSDGYPRPRAWCRSEREPMADVVDLSLSTCGISANPRVLTASALVGTHHCYID